MWELICHHTYKYKGFPVDLSNYGNDGDHPVAADFAPNGAAPGSGALSFTRPEHHVAIVRRPCWQTTWPVLDPALDGGLATVISHRRYSLWLARTENFTARPPWLPSDDLSRGFNARWGNRVVSDPNARRAGMRFPEFWAMFFGGLAKLPSH
jgi:hypothetical protein